MASLLNLWSLLLLVCPTAVVVYRLKLSAVSQVPGPFFARISVLWKIWHLLRGDFHHAIRAAHQRYGPLVRVTHQEVSACSEEAVNLVLAAPLNKADWYRVFAMPTPSFPNQMSELNAEKHIAFQRKTARGYSMATMVQTESRFSEPIQLIQRGVERAAMEDPQGFVNLREWFKYYSYDVVGLATFSQMFGFLETGSDVRGSISRGGWLKTYLSVMAHFPEVHDFIMSLFTPLLVRLDMQPTSYLQQVTESALRERDNSDEAGRDMYALWKHQKVGTPLSELELFTTANANIVAGGEGVANVGSAFVYNMLKSPSHARRLRQELDDALCQGLLSLPASYQMTLQLPFFQACLKEALRVHAIPPIGLSRVIPRGGLEINGHFFSEGCVVSVSQWAVHYDTSLFGNDAYQFNPQRWLNPNSSRSLESLLIPFGKGYMTCPGRNLALFELSKVLVTMFASWDMELDDLERPLRTHGRLVVQGYDWMVKVAKRESSPNSSV